MGGLGSNPELGRSPGEAKGYPLQYSGLEKSMDCIVHGVAESDATERLSHVNCEWGFPMALVVKNLPTNAGDVTDGFDP